MTVVLIGLAVATLALGATCAMVFLARSREAAGRIDRVLAETASAREAAQSGDRRVAERGPGRGMDRAGGGRDGERARSGAVGRPAVRRAAPRSRDARRGRREAAGLRATERQRSPGQVGPPPRGDRRTARPPPRELPAKRRASRAR